MPIVGSFAGASARAYGLGAGVAIGDFESIATVTVGTAVANIEFTSIPQTYTHLHIRAFVKSTTTSPYMEMQLNGDTATNYSRHGLFGDGAGAAQTFGSPTVSYMNFGFGSINANIFGITIMDILDYSNTNKFKSTRTFTGTDFNGSGIAWMFSDNWRSTSAVTSIKVVPSLGNFGQYSSFALYGVKA
jgi:hypothetical protein